MRHQTLGDSRRQLREHKARVALYKFLHAAMWEGESCPAPPIQGPTSRGDDYDTWITKELHRLLGIKEKRKKW